MDRTDSKIDTQLTHESSLKVLKERAAVYAAAQPACKGSLGLFLRRLYADVTGGAGKPN
jgi:hypothetical protein